MGRGKLSMELISNEKSRTITYHKRKKGLTKKAREFHILCGVDTCVIVFGPKFGNRPVDVETWPSDRGEVTRIINKFRKEGTERKKTQDLSDFFMNRKKKVDDEIAKLRKDYLKAKFPVWDNRLDLLSVDQFRALAFVLDAKIELARSWKYLLEESRPAIRGESGTVDDRSSLIDSTSANVFFQDDLKLEALNQQPLSCVQALDVHLPTYYPPDQPLQQMLPFNCNQVINNHMSTMLMNDPSPEFSQFGSMSSSNMILNTATVKSSPVYYDLKAEMLGNMMFTNPGSEPVSYYDGTNQQPMLPYGDQVSPIFNITPQMRMPQLSEFCNINNAFEMDSTNRRL